MSLNTVCITGHLARDPITRFEDNGQQVTGWTLKVDEGQDNRPFTLFVPCEAYGRLGEEAAVLSGEDYVAVEGKLKWKSYVDKTGTKRSTLCVLARRLTVLAAAQMAADPGCAPSRAEAPPGWS